MHSPCRPIAVAAQRALYLAVRVAGSRIIPGRRGTWTEPLPGAKWQELLDQWRSAVGPVDDLVLYRRPQVGRSGLAALLLRHGRGVGFARFHPDEARVEREFGIVSAVHAARPTSFAVARPLASGRLADGGAWLVNESLPNYPLGAVRDPAVRERVADEIGEVLTGVLPRPDGTPAHWRVAHGDLAPWNLRTLLGGAVRVIDWEDACYAPPGVDRLYGALTAHTTFGAPLPNAAPGEAIDWITKKIEGWTHTDTEKSVVPLKLLAAVSAE
ncbi:MAG: phosphotransferase [Micropruina sp.]|uniref:phosphotransferase n=1 Tax=Micropruina sp. TaxID=2737536 RepID=UPI0039E3CA25